MWAQIAGWYGALAILVAYALLSTNALSSQNIWYQLLNVTGAAGLLIVGWYEKVYQSVLLNLVWIGVALYALLQIL